MVRGFSNANGHWGGEYRKVTLKTKYYAVEASNGEKVGNIEVETRLRLSGLVA